jgi:hypothetical protein
VPREYPWTAQCLFLVLRFGEELFRLKSEEMIILNNLNLIQVLSNRIFDWAGKRAFGNIGRLDDIITDVMIEAIDEYDPFSDGDFRLFVVKQVSIKVVKATRDKFGLPDLQKC